MPNIDCPVTKDAFVYWQEPSNFGIDPYLLAESTLWTRSFIQFDLGEIPAGTIIIAAHIDFYAENSIDTTKYPQFTNIAFPDGMSIHKVTEEWVEGSGSITPYNPTHDGVDWYTKDGSNNWAIAGGDVDGESLLDHVSQLGDRPCIQEMHLNGTGINVIQAWINGTDTNKGYFGENGGFHRT